MKICKILWLSIDGRKEVNDRMRIRIDGSGCYDDILPKLNMSQSPEIRIITMLEEPLPGKIWIFPMMCCIWPMKASGDFGGACGCGQRTADMI